MDNQYNPPELFFDGQMIDVLWDNLDNCVKWFEEHFGWTVKRHEDWKIDPRCDEGKMLEMDYGTWFITYLTKMKLPHQFADRNSVDGNVRLCFRVKELGGMHQDFKEKGFKVSSIYDGPKSKYFDIWATSEFIRVTLQEDSTIHESHILPSWIRIGVSQLDASVNWYQKYMGMRIVESNSNYVIMSLKLNHSEDDSFWVIEQMTEENRLGNVNAHVQPYCWIHDRSQFFEYHQFLINQGIETSEIGGFITQGMVGFHFYDLDGNRLNVSSF